MNTPAMTVADERRHQLTEVRRQLDTMLGQFATVLPSHIPPKQFARVVLTAIQNRPELIEVDRRSLWNASMRAAQDGLLPDGRLGAMVVFRDKRLGKVAQWMPMIAGIRQKVRNSGEISTWECHVVRERDHFEYEEGDNPRIVHRPVRGQRGPIIAAYSIAVFKTGERSRELLWVEEIEEIRARSRSPNEGPWVTDYGEMCKKTVARRHSKVLPMSTDVMALLQRDDDMVPALEAPAPPLAPESSCTLTDALNLLAGTTDDDRPHEGPTVEQLVDRMEPDQVADHDPKTGEVTTRAEAQQPSPEPARQDEQDGLPLQQQGVDAQQQDDQRSEIERARVMLRQAWENDILESVWKKLPAAMKRALDVDYKALQMKG